MTEVALVKCNSYDTDLLLRSVRRSVDLLGGIGRFVKPGSKVLLKPNILSARPPEDGVTTNPEFVRAVTRMVKEAGGVVSIGDSPGGYEDDLDRLYEVSGFKKLVAEEGVTLVKFVSSKMVGGVPIADHVLEADCVISLPKFKTHCLTTLTAGIKNMYGAVVGLYKAQRHAVAPGEADFAKIIANVYSITRPCLTIMDGIVAMEGNGPSGGTLRHMDVIAASADACAIDACAAHMMGIKPLDVLITKEAYAMGLGEADLSKISITGEQLDTFIAKDFKLPETKLIKAIPGPLLKFLFSLIKFKPVIRTSVCKRCGVCKKSCPVSAIQISAGRFHIDQSLCVKCLCCHELCPYKAIDIKRNIFAKIVWG